MRSHPPSRGRRLSPTRAARRSATADRHEPGARRCSRRAAWSSATVDPTGSSARRRRRRVRARAGRDARHRRRVRSGKTTTARLALALTEPDDGEVLLSGEPWTGLSRALRRRARRRQITVVYQDPLSSFDPRWSVEQVLLNSLSRDEHPSASRRRARIRELLELVGLEQEHLLSPPAAAPGGSASASRSRAPSAPSRG